MSSSAQVRGERGDHFVVEVDGAFGFFLEAEGFESGDDYVLQVGLAGVDDVVDRAPRTEGDGFPALHGWVGAGYG